MRESVITLSMPSYRSFFRLISTLRYIREKKVDEISYFSEGEINYSIIVNSAFFIEGSLKHFLELLLENLYDDENYDDSFCGRIYDHLQKSIYKRIGIINYNELFEVLTGRSFHDINTKCWEGIKILFCFRNVLAHGRPVVLIG